MVSGKQAMERDRMDGTGREGMDGLGVIPSLYIRKQKGREHGIGRLFPYI